MKKMKWDSNLANLAQSWVNQFREGLPNRSQWRNYTNVGQLMFYTTSSTTSNISARVVEKFHAEYKNYLYENNTCSKRPCGHYTQVMWATSYLLGCALQNCRDNCKATSNNKIAD